MRLTAKTTDGRDIEIEFADLGDSLLAKTETGEPFVALAASFTIDGVEHLSIVSAADAEASGDADTFRLEEDFRTLQSLGIDVMTIRNEGVLLYANEEGTQQ